MFYTQSDGSYSSKKTDQNMRIMNIALKKQTNSIFFYLVTLCYRKKIRLKTSTQRKNNEC